MSQAFIYGGQQRTSDPIKQHFHAIVSYLIWEEKLGLLEEQ